MQAGRLAALAWAVVAAASLGSGTTASAQDPPDASASQDGRDGVAPIKTVVVAAPRLPAYSAEETEAGTRTPTRLQDLPLSVQVVPHQVWEDQAAKDLAQVTRNVSGVTQENIGGFLGAAMMSNAERKLSEDFAEKVCSDVFGVEVKKKG